MNEKPVFAQLLRSPRRNGLSLRAGERPNLHRHEGTLGKRGQSPLALLTIQPTPFCNINCEYCYLPDRNDRSRFNLDLLDPLFRNLRNAGLLGPQLSVSWHAGEPLVLPADYYCEAIDEIDSLCLGTRVNHSFQTNGTLIGDDYCDLFMRPNVHVSLSIDGPAFLHDQKRKTRSGAGTHAKAMEGLEKLKSKGIRFGAIAVISHESLKYADEIYDFFKSNGFQGLALNIDELEGFNRNTSHGGHSEEAYKAFLRQMINRSLQDGSVRWLRESNIQLNRVVDSIYGREAVSAESNPLSLITVDVRGRLYTFSPELAGLDGGAYSIGHVLDCDLSLIWDSPQFCSLNEDISSGVDLCRLTCSYFDVCGGGAPVNKLSENGTFRSTETIFCRLKKKITHDVLEDFAIERLVQHRAKRHMQVSITPET